MDKKRYEQIPHTADLAARIYASTLPELFTNTAYAMFDLMTDLETARSSSPVRVMVDAPDIESLLVAWLNELLYLSFDRGLIFHDFNVVDLTEESLTAEASGSEPGSRLKHEIKAATYHDIDIKKTEEGYEVVIIFDV